MDNQVKLKDILFGVEFFTLDSQDLYTTFLLDGGYTLQSHPRYLLVKNISKNKYLYFDLDIIVELPDPWLQQPLTEQELKAVNNIDLKKTEEF